MERKDEQLIADYRSGDTAAFELLVSRYMNHVYRFVFRYCRTEQDAQDLTQEVFVRVWKNLKRFDQDRYFKVWLFTIAKNISLDWIKKKKPILLSEFENEAGDNAILDTLVDPELIADVAFDEKMSRDFIQEGIQKLASPYKEVITLRFNEALSFVEIAEKLDRSIDTIKSHYRRGTMRLKKILVRI